MSFPETVVAPSGPLDHANRFVALLDRAEPRVRRRFLRLVKDSTELQSLEAMAELMEAGRVTEALAIADDIGPGLATTLDQVYLAAGLSSAEVLRSQVDTLFDFNMANQRAVTHLQQTRLRLVREFSQEQRRATQVFLQDAFERGLAPVEQARALKQSIGLTEDQAKIVQNYRRNLEQRSKRALRRELRDRRFDPTVARAIRTDTPLSTAQIDRMVDRYGERWVAFRAQTIAETESLRAASAADEELWRQAINDGVVPEAALVNTWRTTKRKNVRDSHRAMEGQVRAFGMPFLSGDGNALRYPGDPLAPGGDTIRCKCVVERTLDKAKMADFTPRRLRIAA